MTTEQCSSPSAISRYISHDSYLAFVPAPDACAAVNNNTSNDADFADDALWDDWDLPSTSNKKTPGKIRTMSSPAVHSRTKHLLESTTVSQCKRFISTDHPSAFLLAAPAKTTSLQPVTSNLVWDDDDDDFEQLLSQLPPELPADQPLINQDSILISTPSTDDDNCTRLDATRRASATLTNENQSLVHNATRIELSSQPSASQRRPSTSTLQRANTGPLSPVVTRNSSSSSDETKQKALCTAAEIEQKRLAALALRRQRELERQQKKS